MIDIQKISTLLFKGKITGSQTEGINTLVTEFELRGFKNPRWLAYILATVYHETGRRMQPVTEFGGEAYLRTKKYYPYYGRDLVQTTWKWNYEKVKTFTGVDVVSNPELIKNLKTSAKVAIEFMYRGYYTDKKLADYFNDLKTDPLNARRIINGKDQADLIARYYDTFLSAINL